jgi:outer membrane protein insertion porin family
MFASFLNSRNNFLLIILFIGLFFSLCLADELKKIEIIGNNRLDKKSIISQLNFNIGDNVTSKDLNNALKKLHKTNFFSNVTLNLQDNKLKIEVTENPVLQSLKIRGNKFISTSNIKKVLDIKNDTILNPLKLNQGVRDIELLYKMKGRPSTVVQYEIIKKSPGVIDVVININESKALKIDRIRFIGNEKYTDDDLKRVILSKDFSILRLIGTSYNYIKEKLDIDREMLQRFYQSNGYFDFKVENVSVNTKKEWVSVAFHIHEGEQYKFGKISIESKISELKEIKNENIIDLKIDDIFNINAVNKTSIKISDYLNNNGYLFVNVIPEYKEDSKKKIIDVTFNIFEARKIYIRNINITGNNRTLDKVIRREILLAERDPYNMNKIQMSRRKIFGLGFFDNVEILNREVDDQNIDVDIKVKEKITGYINLSGGYSTEIGLFGNLAMTENNLFGTGNQLGISLKRSMKDFEGSFDFNKVHLFDTNINGNFSIFSESNDKTSESSYKVKTNGFKLGIGYNITSNLYNNIFYSLQSKNIFDVEDGASSAIREQEGKKNISMIGYNLTYNKLDNFIAPSSGYTIKLNQKFAGFGGDLNFVKSEFRVNYFKSILSDNIVLNLVSRGGHVFAYGDDQYVEISQRFFMNEIRGFENSGVGPRDKKTKDALGANVYLLNTAQLEFPLGLPKELDIKGAVFFDNGVLTGTDKKSDNINDSGNFRNAVGAGIIWASPLGKIRIDAGYAITKDDYDKPKVIKFSVGSTL